ALQRDRGERGEGGLFEAHTPGNLRAEVLRNRHDFGVGSVGGDPVADLEAFDTLTDSDDNTGVAIAEAQGLVELRLDGIERLEQTVGLDLLENLLDLIGLSLRLLEDVGL